jgi:hypothetical protein
VQTITEYLGCVPPEYRCRIRAKGLWVRIGCVFLEPRIWCVSGIAPRNRALGSARIIQRIQNNDEEAQGDSHAKPTLVGSGFGRDLIRGTRT